MINMFTGIHQEDRKEKENRSNEHSVQVYETRQLSTTKKQNELRYGTTFKFICLLQEVSIYIHVCETKHQPLALTKVYINNLRLGTWYVSSWQSLHGSFPWCGSHDFSRRSTALARATSSWQSLRGSLPWCGSHDFSRRSTALARATSLWQSLHARCGSYDFSRRYTALIVLLTKQCTRWPCRQYSKK